MALARSQMEQEAMTGKTIRRLKLIWDITTQCALIIFCGWLGFTTINHLSTWTYTHCSVNELPKDLQL